MIEEHGGEGGLLEEVVDDRGKITKTALTKRLKEIARDEESREECTILEAYFAMLDKEAEVIKKAKDAQKALIEKVIKQYGDLTDAEVKTLVVQDKWLAILDTEIRSELDCLSQVLTGRNKELIERYSTPLLQATQIVGDYTAKVEAVLYNMGLTWM